MKQVIVIGAGASGMLAAIAAARRGCAVTVLEGMEKPGKKLLLTGSGKCNLTNTEFPAGSYRGAPDSFAETVLAQFSPEETRAFFQELGLPTYERGGYVYPVSGQASSVLEVLLLELSRLSVKLKCNEKVTAIERMACPQQASGQESADSRMQATGQEAAGLRMRATEQKPAGFRVHTAGWTYEADAVILAAGSKAAAATGSDGSGYALAKSLGHHIVTPLAALVPLLVREPWIQKLSGIRMPARITLVCESGYGPRGNLDQAAAEYDTNCRSAVGHNLRGVTNGGTDAEIHAELYTEIYTEEGELQWTDYGISGIAVFQLSRYAARALAEGRKVCAELDLLPGLSMEALCGLLTRRAGELFAETAFPVHRTSGRSGREALSAAGSHAGRSPSGKFCARDLLAGMFPKKAAGPLLAQAKIREDGRGLSDGQIHALAASLKCLRLTVCGTRDFSQAQVCQGGVDCAEVDARTMESRIVPGLYLTGELLDVDGACGGYNLQWAWSSGFVAGKSV